MPIPATRDDPPDVAEVTIGVHPHSIGAAEMLINAIFRMEAEAFWENEGLSRAESERTVYDEFN